MKLILRGRRFGFKLEEMRQWLELYDADPEQRLQRKAWMEWPTSSWTSCAAAARPG